MQTTSHLLMIRPVRFGYNPETAVNNAFQKQEASMNIQELAVNEFDEYVKFLRSKGMDVTVVDDTPEPHTPDSIFPNNWISFHEGGTICLYPMFAENRRLERKQHVLDAVYEKFEVKNVIDFTAYEADSMFLEGTGSMILDKPNKLAYACLSPRTNKTVFLDFCDRLGFEPIYFTSEDNNGQAIYHTNVMMCVGEQYVVICTDSVKNEAEKKMVLKKIEDSGKVAIPISMEQMNSFAGNMLQVRNGSGKLFLLMSDTAYQSLSIEQRGRLGTFNEIICPSLYHVEVNGGGSARCMVAEVFLAAKK
ncbi:MAG: amidinotransferase [Prevotellaceae bacterium]|jgi:hypothetical protein|nr:amidinotransferase [Prevotellaceae bacterium]